MERFLVYLSSFLLNQWLREKRGRDSRSCFGVVGFIERRGTIVCFPEVGLVFPRSS